MSAPTFDRALLHDDVGHGCFAVDLDGQIHGYVPSIRDRLIERGVLRQDAHGVWQLAWHGFDLERERAADMSCCDFCSARPVTWLVPCASFAMPSGGGIPESYSVGDWAACATCGDLIAHGARRPLLTHCLKVEPPLAQMFGGAVDIPAQLRAMMRKTKTEVHARFWRHYRGGAVQVTPHPYGH